MIYRGNMITNDPLRIYSSLPQIYEQTSEKYETCFNIFHCECRIYSSLPQIYKQTSEKYETCFNIFHCGNAKLALLATTEALALQRSAACRPKGYIRVLTQIYARKSEKVVQANG